MKEDIGSSRGGRPRNTTRSTPPALLVLYSNTSSCAIPVGYESMKDGEEEDSGGFLLPLPKDSGLNIEVTRTRAAVPVNQ